MAQSRFKRENTKYELVNFNREEDHFKLITKHTNDLGLSTKYVDSLVKIERFYIKLIKSLLLTAFVLFPISLLLYSVYQSFDTCNGLLGETVNVFWKYHKNYNKFNFKYENFYDPRSEVDFYKYPWMVRIISKSFNKSNLMCSGFLITDRDIATAAHCYYEFEYRTEIHLGGTAKNNFSDSIIISNNNFKVLNHPKFSYKTPKYDIALIKLDKPISFSKTIYPIRLPFDDPSIPQTLTLTGWTSKKYIILKPTLKEINIPIFSIDECTQKANRKFDDQIVLATIHSHSFSAVPMQFCGGFDYTYISPGDSGMPIQQMNENEPVAYGIISIGPKAGLYKPQIFTNIYPFLHWILCNAGDEFCKFPKK